MLIITVSKADVFKTELQQQISSHLHKAQQKYEFSNK